MTPTRAELAAMHAASVATVLHAIAAILWPLAAIGVAVILRRELRGMFGRVIRARFPGGEIELARQEVNELAKEETDEETKKRLTALESRLARLSQTPWSAPLAVRSGDRVLLIDSTFPSGEAIPILKEPHHGSANTEPND